MKRSIILAALLVISRLATASCMTLIDYTMSIKNSTEHVIYIDSCTGYTDSGPKASVQPGDSYTAAAEPGGSTYTTTPSCQYTVLPNDGDDSTDLQSGTLYFNFNSCTDVKTETSNTLSGNSINAYACPSATNNYGAASSTSVSGVYIITQTQTYNMVWNNIKTSLAKGQVMATTLANSLAKINSYQTSKATYDYDNKRISITLKESGNPYPTNASINQCKDINSGTAA